MNANREEPKVLRFPEVTASAPLSPEDSPLVRSLGAWDAAALVVGSVIGSGVFLKAAVMAQTVSTPLQVMLAWLAGGVLSLLGALTYAELGAMLPHAGGEYIYLKHSFGQATAFFYGWGRFAVAGTASIAAIAAAMAGFTNDVIPLGNPWLTYDLDIVGNHHQLKFGCEQAVAVGSILVLSLLNCFAVAFGGKFNTFVTAIKVASIAIIVFGVMCFSSTGSWSNLARPEGAPNWSPLSAFGLAMLAALWGYDGWNNMPMAAGEVRDPGKNMPRALIGGMILVMLIYCSINLAFLYALPFAEVAASDSPKFDSAPSVAAKASSTFLGTSGARFISIAFVVSTFGALSSTILTSARIPYAMARDRLFFSSLGKVHASSRVPVIAILVQAIWSSILALSGTFEQLTNCLLFVSWIFYGLVASGVIIMRFTHPQAVRPYKVWGYPFTPILFIIVSACLTVNTYFEEPVIANIGLALLALGFPVYLFFRIINRKHLSSPPAMDA